MTTEIITAIINNLAAILMAIGTCATALAGAWIAVKQSQTHTTVTALKDKYDADHPANTL